MRDCLQIMWHETKHKTIKNKNKTMLRKIENAGRTHAGGKHPCTSRYGPYLWECPSLVCRRCQTMASKIRSSAIDRQVHHRWVDARSLKPKSVGIKAACLPRFWSAQHACFLGRERARRVPYWWSSSCLRHLGQGCRSTHPWAPPMKTLARHIWAGYRP